MVRTISEYRLVGKMASKFLSYFPKSMSVYTNTTPIDWKNTTAYLSDPSGGLRAYSYAGIKIKKDGMDEVHYEETCDKIIELLLAIKDPTTSENLVEWALKREELYKGEYFYKYPDVLFKLRNEWGVGWEINEGIFGKSLSHKIHSGNHRQETAVFLVYGNNLKSVDFKANMTLMDVAPTLMDLMDLKSIK